MALEFLTVGIPHVHPAIAGAPDSHDRDSRNSGPRQPCTRGMSITNAARQAAACSLHQGGEQMPSEVDSPIDLALAVATFLQRDLD